MQRRVLSAPLVQRYLSRLGLPRAPPPSMAGLATLLHAHLAKIPYCNLDIHTGAGVSSLESVDAAAERLLRGRGGYCFHSAPPFAALLNACGFEASIYSGQVVSHPGSPPEPANPNHAVVIVSSLRDAPTRQVLADVGIGDGPRNPVPLRTGIFHEPPFAYGIERVSDSVWRFFHDSRGGFSHFEVDCGEPAPLDVFVEPHRRLSTLEESVFVQTFTVQRVDDGLIEKIVNRSFRRLSRAGTSERLIESEEHLGTLLRGTFQLTVSDEECAAIWQRLLRRESSKLTCN